MSECELAGATALVAGAGRGFSTTRSMVAVSCRSEHPVAVRRQLGAPRLGQARIGAPATDRRLNGSNPVLLRCLA
jgi:hypothetical protein